jgi:hypothetical protein
MAHKKYMDWRGPPLQRAFTTIFHLHTLTIVLSILQATATLTIGLIIGLIYMWKVGLVGLGK